MTLREQAKELILKLCAKEGWAEPYEARYHFTEAGTSGLTARKDGKTLVRYYIHSLRFDCTQGYGYVLFDEDGSPEVIKIWGDGYSKKVYL